MPLRFVLDEHLRGPLWTAIQRENVVGGYPIDVVRVGDLPELPCGSDDPRILKWASGHDRIVVMQDAHKMPSHLESHVGNGARSPGIIMVRVHQRMSDVVEALQLAAYAGKSADFENFVTFAP